MRQFLFSRSGLVFLGFLAVAGYFLWAEHQVHVVAVLPWLLIGGCLVMHLFMHHGHGGHGGSGADRKSGGSADDDSESDSRRSP